LPPWLKNSGEGHGEFRLWRSARNQGALEIHQQLEQHYSSENATHDNVNNKTTAAQQKYDTEALHIVCFT